LNSRSLSESESYVTTDGQSAGLSWNKAPIWGLRPDFYCRTEYGIRLTVTFLIPWGALSDERTSLSFTIAAGSCQRSHSRIRVPWDSRPYFTVTDSRLPFSSPRTTHRATVEVFDLTYTREASRTLELSLTNALSLWLGANRRETTTSNTSCITLLLFVFCTLLRNVTCDLLPSNGGPTVDCVNSKMCLPNRYLAMVIFVTILN
jgi:hypothetical protein